MLEKGDIIFCEWNGELQMRTVERVSGTNAYSGYQKFRRIPLRSGQILPLSGPGAFEIKYWEDCEELQARYRCQQSRVPVGQAA